MTHDAGASVRQAGAGSSLGWGPADTMMSLLAPRTGRKAISVVKPPSHPRETHTFSSACASSMQVADTPAAVAMDGGMPPTPPRGVALMLKLWGQQELGRGDFPWRPAPRPRLVGEGGGERWTGAAGRHCTFLLNFVSQVNPRLAHSSDCSTSPSARTRADHGAPARMCPLAPHVSEHAPLDSDV